MDRALFEQLLHEDETATLDFKEEQYRFVKATADDKSELLKDILGFANAWRRADAYILIGVEEVRGGRSNVVGLAPTDHLDDHSLQQFVNNSTQRPVRFHYEAFEFEGKQVGILRIEKQPKPIYLKRDYGKLAKDKVYIRRGTSTDPSKPASPDEISLMGQAEEPQTVELEFEFAETENESALGPRRSWDSEFLELPPIDQIPDLTSPPAPSHISGMFYSQTLFDQGLNSDYFRQLAKFHFIRRLLRPVRLVLKNVGQVSARIVRCEFSLSRSGGAHVLTSSDMPDAPRRRSSRLDFPISKHLLPPAGRTPGDVVINENDEQYRIEIDWGDVQPGRQVWSDIFYAGKQETGEIEFSGNIYAENLPKPKGFTLVACVTVNRKIITASDVRNLPEPPGDA